MKKTCLALGIALLSVFMFVSCNNDVAKAVTPNEIVSKVVKAVYYDVVDGLESPSLFWVNEEHSEYNKQELINKIKYNLELAEGAEVTVGDDSIEIKGMHNSEVTTLAIKITDLGKKAKKTYTDAVGKLSLSYKYEYGNEKYEITASGSFVYSYENNDSFVFSEVSYGGKAYDVEPFNAVIYYVMNNNYKGLFSFIR